MSSKLIPSAWSYLQAFTKLVINRNTEVEHLLSFLSSPLLPNLRHHIAHREHHFLFGPVTQSSASTVHSTRPQAF